MAEDLEPDEPFEWMAWRFGSTAVAPGEPGTASRQRYEFARHHAAPLAAAALGSTAVPYRSERSVSLRTVLFSDRHDECLVVVVGDHEPTDKVELAVPYGLEHLGDRDLLLVVPAGTEWPLVARLPWLDVHARVFTHHDGEVVEQPLPARADVLAAVEGTVAVPGYTLGAAQEGWVDELTAWADGHPRLAATHRSSYASWQVDGRQALRIERIGGGRVRITAGAGPFTLVEEIDGPLLDPHPFREAVRRAIAERTGGDDTGNLEHRFQSRIADLPTDRRLGLDPLVPEFPATRPRVGGNSRGSIDFLGVDADRTLHVVETKVGAKDPLVVLQALDYWIWATANRTALADEYDADPERAVIADVVVLPAGGRELLERHNLSVLERLSRSVPVRLHAGRVELDGSLHLDAVARPAGPARTHSARMRRRLAAAAPAPDDEVLEATLVELRTRGVAHRFLDVPHSSQRFAARLFSLLDADGVRTVLARRFGAMADADPVHLEWTDPDDLLRESTPGRPAATQVDAVLSGTTIGGQRVALLVEVKLTEAELGGCSHIEHADEHARAVCRSDGPFGSAPDVCFQLRNRDTGVRRRYDEVLEFEDWSLPATVERGCWFRRRNQAMRNAALAAALVEAGRFDRVAVALCCPPEHASMRRRWTETAAMITNVEMGMLEPAEVLATCAEHRAEAAATLSADVGLHSLAVGELDAAVAMPARESLVWSLVAELFGRCPGRFEAYELHPGGGLYDVVGVAFAGAEADESPEFFIHPNLEGRIHQFGPASATLDGAWELLARGQVEQLLWWLRPACPPLAVGLGEPGVSGASVMAEIASLTAGRWRWRQHIERRRSTEWWLVPDDRRPATAAPLAVEVSADPVTATGTVGERRFDLIDDPSRFVDAVRGLLPPQPGTTPA